MRRWVVTSLLAVVSAGGPVGAQAVSLGFAAGVAVPTGAYGAARASGPVVQGVVTAGGPTRRVRLRAEAEAAWFAGQEVPAGRGLSAGGDLRVAGVGLSLLMGPRGGPVRPYALVGAARQWIRVPGRVNPYGSVFGVRAGAGVRAAVGRTEVRLEVTPHVVLSDYATGREFDIGSYWPVTVGVSF